MEKYSVLMAVYYRETAANLRCAIGSMLAQTAPPEEFVLVCDGPLTASLDAVIEDFCAAYPGLFRILRLKENQGLGVALNRGLRLCGNELVARMDSDDIALPDRMERQLAEMERDPSLSVLGGQTAEFRSDPGKIEAYRRVPVEEARIRTFLKFRNPVNHMTVLLRKSHILQVGSYRSVAGFEDYHLWIRLIAAGYRIRNLDAICCMARADAGLYARRGGVVYFQNTLKMERLLLETKLISHGEYLKNVFVRFLGTIVLPAGARRLIFLLLLRSREPRNREPAWRVPERIPGVRG